MANLISSAGWPRLLAALTAGVWLLVSPPLLRADDQAPADVQPAARATAQQIVLLEQQCPEFDVEQTAAGMTIVRHWDRVLATIVFVGGLFIGGILCVALVMKNPPRVKPHVLWLTWALVTPFALLFVGLLYAGTAMLVNSTTIQITPDTLSVTHGPLPWLGSSSIARSEIVRFDITESRTHRKHGSSTTYYALEAILTGGRHAPLAKDFLHEWKATNLMHVIRAGLGMPDCSGVEWR